jgi:hypothetical protein
MLEATYFSESWPVIVDFFDFVNTFYVGFRSKSGTIMHSGSGSAKAKNSCGSG